MLPLAVLGPRPGLVVLVLTLPLGVVAGLTCSWAPWRFAVVVLIPVALPLAAALIASILLAGEACRQVQGALRLKSVVMAIKLQATKKQPAKGWLLVMQGLDLVAQSDRAHDCGDHSPIVLINVQED